MCGRLSLYAGVDVIIEYLLTGRVQWAPRWNIAPTQRVPVVLVDDDQRQLQLMRWGLVPPWKEDPAKGPPLINARSETAASKPSFRTAFERRRCLVPATGFYEWKRQGKAKTPFHFTLAGAPLMTLAGLWEVWHDLDGTELRSFTILTTGPNAVMEPIHDRMPVILSPDEWEGWLDPSQGDREALQALLRPYPGEDLRRDQVSPRVNSWKNDDAECARPVGQATLFSL